ncbi:MAG TPA: aminopeptidase P family protein [Candidatus Merdisoma merdipullorum]|nr:aminopeptidase P family protein [Candidatus Merdisoma merdipullorum]
MRDLRQEELTALLEERDLDAALVSCPANIRYLSGFVGTESYLYLSKERGVILTDSRYTLQAKEEAKGFEVQTIGGGRGYGSLLAELILRDRVRALGFEENSMLYGTVRKLQKEAGLAPACWKPLGDTLSLLRAVKRPEEIEKMERAERIGDEAFSYILNELKPGVTELQIAAKLEYFMRSQGAEGTSFDTIVASGLHSAMPHAVPTEKPLEKGDFVTMDFGCKYQGYCSDMTRTVVIGKADEKQKELYRIVLEAQEAALCGLRPGMTGAEGDRLARDVIEKAGYGEYFGHGLGHSVGLEIHERPALSARDKTVLLPGMIETVEPGIYIPGFGGVRIEDMVTLTQSGIRNLTSSPKELIEL